MFEKLFLDLTENASDIADAVANSAEELAEAGVEVAEVITDLAEPANDLGTAVTVAQETFVEETSSFIKWITGFFTWGNLFRVIGVAIVLLILWLLYKLIVRGLKKIPTAKVTVHRQMLIKRMVKYAFYTAAVMYICHSVGINLSAIWGAAGIAGVAIGFAAQTSVSNLISGLFVLTEGTLKVGDLIIVGDITGTVASITLLSIRVNTLDNQMVRIPNSTIINGNLTNINYNNQRRITLSVSIAYESDMKKALEALQRVPDLCPTVLKNPEYAVWFDGFADSGINMTIAAWFKPSDFLKTKNDLYIAIKQVFDEAGIEIPFNQLDVKIKNPETLISSKK